MQVGAAGIAAVLLVGPLGLIPFGAATDESQTLGASLLVTGTQPRATLSPDGTLELSGWVRNVGSTPTAPGEIEVMAGQPGMAKVGLGAVQVPPVAVGGDVPWNFTSSVTPGTWFVEARAWTPIFGAARISQPMLLTVKPADLSIEEPVFVTDAALRPVPARPDYQLEGGKLIVELGALASIQGYAMVAKAWLDGHVLGAALVGPRLEVITLGLDSYLAVPLPLPSGTSIAFEAFVPTADARWTLGHPESILLEQEPMAIAINHGESESTNWVTLDFQGNHDGQPVWIKSDWLQREGVSNPTFVHEDGTLVSVQLLGAYYRLLPEHFSEIHAFTTTIDPWQHVSDQPSADVRWNSAAGRIDLTPAYVADKDESFVRRFVPPAEFTVTAKFGEDGVDDGQGVYPIAIGNFSDRANPAPLGAPNGALGFEYIAGGTFQNAPPSYHTDSVLRGFYTTPYGKRQNIFSWTTPWTSYEWKVQLSINVTATDAVLEIRAPNGTIEASGTVSKSALALGVMDALFVGTKARTYGFQFAYDFIYVDDVAIETRVGNLINSEFDSASAWTTSGSAVVDALNSTLQLTNATANSAGRAVSDTLVNAAAFAAEFKAKSGVGSPGGEGMALLFFKNTAYTAAPGYRLGFSDDNDAGLAGHEGYGLELDSVTNSQSDDPAVSHVAVIKDTTGTHLAAAPTSLNDGLWHTYNLDVFDDGLQVYVDGALAKAGTHSFDRTNGGFGFSGATGTLATDHLVDYLRVSVRSVYSLPSNSAPSAPSNPGPSNGSANVETGVQLSWSSHDADHPGVGFSVKLGTTSPPSTVVCTTGTSNNYYGGSCRPAGLVGNTTYFWQVIVDDGLAQVHGPVWSFTTFPNSAPDVPAPSGPTNGSVGTKVFLTLQWNGTDPDNNSLRYDVKLGTSNPPSTLRCRTYDSTCSTGQLTHNTQYFWQVLAFDGFLWTASPIFAFTTTSNQRPDYPQILSPGSYSGVNNVNATWHVGSADGATPTYNVYLGKKETECRIMDCTYDGDAVDEIEDDATGFNTVWPLVGGPVKQQEYNWLRKCKDIARNYCVLPPLEHDTKYMLLVVATGITGQWSRAWTYVTTAPNSAPLPAVHPVPAAGAGIPFGELAEKTPATGADFSGRGRNLAPLGLTTVTSPVDKYGVGYAFNGTSSLLTGSNPAWNLAENASLFLAWDYAGYDYPKVSGPDLPSERILVGLADPGQGIEYLMVAIRPDGRLVYRHSTSSCQAAFTSASAIPEGFHTLWLRRDQANSAVRLVVDGIAQISQTHACPLSVPPGSTGSLSFFNHPDRTRPLSGSLFEARVWDKAVSPTLLNRMANGTESSLRDRSEGSEAGLYFIGTPEPKKDVTLSWVAPPEPDGSGVTHTVFLDTTNPPTAPQNGCIKSTRSFCGLTGLRYNTTYYWQVETDDGTAVTRASPWSFTTDALCSYRDSGTWKVPHGYVLGGENENSKTPQYRDFTDGCSPTITLLHEIRMIDASSTIANWTSCRNSMPANYSSANYCGQDPTNETQTPDGKFVRDTTYVQLAMSETADRQIATVERDDPVRGKGHLKFERFISDKSEQATDPVNVVFYGAAYKTGTRDVLVEDGGWDSICCGCSSPHTAFMFESDYGGSDARHNPYDTLDHDTVDCTPYERYHTRVYGTDRFIQGWGKYVLAPTHYEDSTAPHAPSPNGKHDIIDFDRGRDEMQNSLDETPRAPRMWKAEVDYATPPPHCSWCVTDSREILFVELRP